MSSKEQADFFKSLNDEEENRLKSLRDTARFYVGLTSIYTAFVMFVAEKLRPNECFSKSIFAFTMLAMVLAFVCSVQAINISAYRRVANPEEWIDKMGPEPATEVEFFNKRIICYTAACMTNGRANDQKAWLVKIAGVCLLIGLISHTMFFLDWLIAPGGFNVPAKS